MRSLLGALSAKDFIAIAGYFAVVMSVGLFFSRKKKTTTDYFLAGRSLGWIGIGTSIFSASISIEHLVGYAAAGSTSGLAVAALELIASLVLLLLGWKLAPIFLQANVNTMPEFLEQRFGSSLRLTVSAVSIAFHTLTKFCLMLHIGTSLLKYLLNWDATTSAALLVIAAAAYTLLGGMKSVVYTNFIQAGALIVGSLALARIGLREAGAGFRHFFNTTPADIWTMIRPIDHPEFPWTGVLFGAPILAFWFLCTDQYMMQRVLGAKSSAQARRGAILAALLKIAAVFLLVLPGMLAFKISGGNMSGDGSYGWMVTTFLPKGIRGAVIAGVFAVLMSSLSNTFHAGATLFSLDIFRKLQPRAGDKVLVNSGRLAAGFLAILGIAWIPIIGLHGSGGALMQLLNVQAAIAPPIAAVFLAGLFWKRADRTGAFASLVVGLSLGGLRLILQAATDNTSSGGLWNFFVFGNPLHFAAIHFALCFAILVFASRGAKRGTQPQADNVATASSLPQRTELNKLDLVASAIVVAVVVGLLLLLR